SVGRFKQGDRISMGYSVSCGHCYMCEVEQTAHCETTKNAVYGFGVPFGGINGTHAEALIVPHADGHAMNVPKGIPDEAAVTLSCNLPSAIIANRLADI
ncbi:alcohol dehydrogenase catalytic domain-containing protein, partial [Klebsiella pneumoniae]|nr:alcohol dehydrogenase catalytic domain-containing protein [Klebsiella pneumoniae]